MIMTLTLDLTSHAWFVMLILLLLWSALTSSYRSIILDLATLFTLTSYFCMWEWALQGKDQEKELELDSDEAETEIEVPLPLTVTSRVS